MNMSMNTLSLSNVVIGEDLQKSLNKEGLKLTGVFGMLDPVVSRLASLNPLWTFVIVNSGLAMGNDRVACGFSVKLDGEELGQIGLSYMGQRGRVISISNDRIGKGRQRSDSYRTVDADKAILTAKKMFGKMNPNERISKAKDAAERVVTRASWNKERERTLHQGNIKNEMLVWAETKGHAMFLEYLKAEAIPSLRHKVTTSMEKVELLDTEMKTIERVQADFSKNKTALVVKDSGKYLVKIGDKVDLYDDNTLPVDMRMKMGMLKLVEDEQYLTDVGCKVSSEIFVLLVDELTNVSEGV
jgi:hypothetical protein